jgi:hypothetical protein
MKKNFCLLILPFLLLIIYSSASSQIRVCKGISLDDVWWTIDDPRFLKAESDEVLYTIRDATLCEGTSYDVVFTRRDKTICTGTSYEVLMTERGYNFCSGTSYDVDFTYRDNVIYKGTSFDEVLYTFRDGTPTETVLMYMMAIIYTTQAAGGEDPR